MAVLLIISLISMYLYNSYTWSYDESVFQFQVKNRAYDLKNPKQKWILPKDLEEISGLAHYSKNKLGCVQDEDGYFYIYDLEKENIERKGRFAKKGDYEGVEIVDEKVYVLESKGDIYVFGLEKQGIGEVKKIKTDLSGKNDTEGLGYFEEDDVLLIACKEDPGNESFELEKGRRSVYGITRSGMEFRNKPKYILDGKSYIDMLEKKGLSKKKHTPFKPSGVAVHPRSNNIFLIGTVGKMMVILNTAGEIEDIIPLDPSIFWQPEGICFSPDGDLYISSEGRGKKGYILKF